MYLFVSRLCGNTVTAVNQFIFSKLASHKSKVLKHLLLGA
jgi:hypothetical protein